MSAIQPDVQQQPTQTQEQQTQARKPVVTDRMAALEAITTARHADFEKETGVKIEPFVSAPGDDDDPDAAAAEAERARLEAEANGGQHTGGEDDTQRQLQQEQQTPAATKPALDPAAKIKIKVNGVDQEITGEEALRRLQKDVSADQRLEQAARERREIDEQRRQLEAQQATTQNTTGEVQIDPQVTNELAAALKTGDEAQLTQAFTKAVSSAVQAATNGKGAQATQAVDVAAITAQVRQQIAIDSVLAQSRADYPQLYADPDVEAVAASKISRLQAEGKPFAEALETVQTEMATKFKWDKASQQGRPAVAPDTSRRDEKLKRKEGLDLPISTPNVKSGTTEAKPESVSDVIKQMAAQRGQTV